MSQQKEKERLVILLDCYGRVEGPDDAFRVGPESKHPVTLFPEWMRCLDELEKRVGKRSGMEVTVEGKAPPSVMMRLGNILMLSRTVMYRGVDVVAFGKKHMKDGTGSYSLSVRARMPHRSSDQCLVYLAYSSANVVEWGFVPPQTQSIVTVMPERKTQDGPVSPDELQACVMPVHEAARDALSVAANHVKLEGVVYVASSAPGELSMVFGMTSLPSTFGKNIVYLDRKFPPDKESEKDRYVVTHTFLYDRE